MSGLIHKTKGIVLKTVNYGETSIVATIYTELFGLQSYLVNGVRGNSKKGSSKYAFFQPAAVLDLVVYYNEFRQLHRIKEYKWAVITQQLYTDVIKNGVALFMIELLTKCLKQPEANPDLFAFTEDNLIHLNNCNDAVMANFPLFYAVQLCSFFGFSPHRKDTSVKENGDFIFDLQEGFFTNKIPYHPQYLENVPALILSDILKIRQPEELEQIKTSSGVRTKILHTLEAYYRLHIQDFGQLKTLPVLKEILR